MARKRSFKKRKEAASSLDDQIAKLHELIDLSNEVILNDEKKVEVYQKYMDLIPSSVERLSLRGLIKISFTNRLLKDLRTSQTTIVEKVIEKIYEPHFFITELNGLYSDLLAVYDTYVYDPEKSIPIIEPAPAEQEPVPDLPPLGYLSRKDIVLIWFYQGRNLQDLNQAVRNRLIQVLDKLVYSLDEATMKRLSMATPIELPESVEMPRHEELTEHEESVKKEEPK